MKKKSLGLVGLALFMFGTAMADDVDRGNKVPVDFRKLNNKVYSALINKGLIRDQNTLATCGEGDEMTFEEKVSVSDLVVEGEITSVKYLYRMGGPFRTEYSIRVDRTLFGSAPSGKIRVLSQYGPNTRDHRRWKAAPLRLEFEAGDKGIFILTENKLRELASRNSAHAKSLENSYMFQGHQKGVYLFNDDQQPDSLYMEASHKSDVRKNKVEYLASVLKVKQALDQAEKE